MTRKQAQALESLCARFKVPFVPATFHPTFDLPEGYVAGYVGPIYVGCSPEGEIAS